MYLNNRSRQLILTHLRQKDFIISAWLYGSYARGSAGKNSDIDILVTLDYEKLAGRGREFLELSSLLSVALGIRVSVVSNEALSSAISPFIKRYQVEIYNAKNTPDSNWLNNVLISFDRKEFRDKAILEHIEIALKLVAQWFRDYPYHVNDKQTLYVSALSRELQQVSGLVSKLTLASQQSLEESGPANNLSPVLKNLTGPYFGLDKAILLDIVEHDLPNYSNAVKALLENWDSRYKQRLSYYFIGYLERLVTESIRTELNYANLAITNTITATDILVLTTEHIVEGERNLTWVASQLNVSKTWDKVKDFICPFFPFCS